MYSIDWVANKLSDALHLATVWLLSNNAEVMDCVVSEDFTDGFEAWRVRIYYTTEEE